MKKLITNVISCMVVFAFVQMASAQTVKSMDRKIEARIKPVGNVCVEGDPCAQATSANASASSSSGSGASGEQTYKKVCSACHAAGVAGAPKFGSYSDWQPRIAQGMKKLYDAAEHGFKGMPPKGTCTSCSNAEIEATVDYMVNAAKKNKG